MLYEHQSTKNPNIPLRNLFYVSDIYSKLTKDENLFGTRLIKIPEPKFVVFYNGIANTPERFIYKLSNMFGHPTKRPFEQISRHTSDQPPEHSSDVSLELITRVFNINLGYNEDLMKKCRTLHDYAFFVALVRRYQKEMPLEPSMERAIRECIADGVLADFLRENRAEVVKMGLYEYDEEKCRRMEREYVLEAGVERGKLRSLTSVIKKKYLKKKSLEEIADDLEMNTSDIKNIYELISEHTDMTDDEIVKELLPEYADLFSEC